MNGRLYMKLAEKICDKYARMNTLKNITPVTAIMPLGEELDDVVVTNSISAQPGIGIWNGIKDEAVNLTGGISGMMIRKLPQELQLSKVIENYQWKEKEILGILLPGNLLFAFHDRLA